MSRKVSHGITLGVLVPGAEGELERHPHSVSLSPLLSCCLSGTWEGPRGVQPSAAAGVLSQGHYPLCCCFVSCAQDMILFLLQTVSFLLCFVFFLQLEMIQGQLDSLTWCHLPTSPPPRPPSSSGRTGGWAISVLSRRNRQLMNYCMIMWIVLLNSSCILIILYSDPDVECILCV